MFMSKVNTAVYQDVLKHLIDDLIIKEDLAHAHTAKITNAWFNEHEITVLANSPDLNPRENVWGILKRKMRDMRPNNADEILNLGFASVASNNHQD